MGQNDETKEVVHVKAKKYDGFAVAETKRFSIDPRLTNLLVLRELLTKAFHIKGDFVISYLVPCSGSRNNGDRFLPMLSDWDLNTAISDCSQYQLVLKVDMKPFEEGLADWDIIVPDDIATVEGNPGGHESTASSLLFGASDSGIADKIKQISWLGTSAKAARKKSGASATKNVKSPMTDSEFRSLLDSEGGLKSAEQLRLWVYQCGVESSLRPVVWRHLLNIYPRNLTGKQRIDYTKRLAEKYYCMKECWQKRLKSGRSSDELRVVANAVRKDVVRTDRAHPYFSGQEETNANVLALFNVLTTYALCHPDIAYCQGMSDLASPLLVVMRDEAQAYICFCALMQRLGGNFMCDGRVMTRKFQHLSELLQFYDPVFYEYLKEMNAEDLLFCYRWLLLELKREFTFDDALLVLEVMWASLPPEFPDTELPLFQVDLSASGDMPFLQSLRFPVNNRALKLLNLTEINSLEQRSESPTSSETDSTVESTVRSKYEELLELEMNLIDHSVEDEPTEKVKNGNGMAENFSTDRIGSVLHSVHSCPGNLAGLCHAAVVRSLMLGKSSETRLHSCHRYRSYPPTFTLWEDSGTFPGKYCKRSSRRLHSESCTDTETSSSNHFFVGSLDRACFMPVVEEDSVGHQSVPDDRILIMETKESARLSSVEETKEESASTLSLSSDLSSEVTLNLYQDAKGRCGSFGSGVTINCPWNSLAEDRNIKPSTELPVADDRSGTVKEEASEEQASPVPLASEATTVLGESSNAGELTLTDIYDICVAQVPATGSQLSPPSSVNRSRQTSGDQSGAHNASPREPSSGYGTGGTKSRHASSSQAAATVGDSGYSGATTPYTHSVDLLPTENKDRAAICTSSSAPALSTGGVVEFVNIEKDAKFLLPPPEEFGDGNPFMMFVCLTLLMEHRDRIIRRGMDFNEIAIYFDRLARKHSALKILRQARHFYSDYLRSEWFLESTN